ncbi:endonuclease V isoform X1 [Eutrema salsugineum]|uniref:endonuclease V isoform X1 n=1 Tax=Eutrema salsugineum TaxID=72664 RepID=UPI000CED160D|nr:endonuclease V isoform X1 [Eutrema salsugineum]
MDGEGASGESSSGNQLENWTEEQDRLKKKLIAYDDFPWKLSSSLELPQGSEMLNYVGGVDMSFSKEDPSIACACLVVLELPSLRVVHHDFSLLRLHVPYVPGFLAFREAAVLLQILQKMRDDHHPFYPQVLMVDGNGILHPRGFGLACHLGVLADIPTIGVGKNLHHVDGLNQSEVRQSLQLKENQDKQVITLVGNSGFTWGVAFRPILSSLRPIYVSVGHRTSLDSAVKIVKMTCKYRVPEPIRQADIRSRAYLQKHQLCLLKELGPRDKGNF